LQGGDTINKGGSESGRKWGAFDSPCTTLVLGFPTWWAKSGTPTSGTIFDWTEK
jgi:hypothetical protein